MKKYLLLSLAMVVALPSYAALDCATPPTCDDLGYTQSASDCAGQFILKCPFDETAVFCGGDTPAGKCINEEYTLNDGANCDTYYKKETCSHDNSYYKCTEMTTREKCAKDGYMLITCNTENGYYVTGRCSHDNQYVSCELDTCSTGYVKAEICAAVPAIVGTTSTYRIACSNGIKVLSIISDNAGYACYKCASSGIYVSQDVFCDGPSIIVK